LLDCLVLLLFSADAAAFELKADKMLPPLIAAAAAVWVVELRFVQTTHTLTPAVTLSIWVELSLAGSPANPGVANSAHNAVPIRSFLMMSTLMGIPGALKTAGSERPSCPS
jgi:hypothetical protein